MLHADKLGRGGSLEWLDGRSIELLSEAVGEGLVDGGEDGHWRYGGIQVSTKDQIKPIFGTRWSGREERGEARRVRGGRKGSERTLTVANLSLLDGLHVAVQVINEMFALGVVHRLGPERAGLLKVDYRHTKKQSIVSDQHRSNAITPKIHDRRRRAM